MDQTSRYCKRCSSMRLFQRTPTSHVFHLLVTLVACGLWLPIWVLSSIKIGGWRCSSCGKWSF